jgi:drug/metabolite transporter (DMT)-like permease
MKPREWVVFFALGLIWGSSFLWIKIAVQEVDPFTLVSWRLLFGTLGMVAVIIWKRPSFPPQRSIWLALAVLGIINTALPFVLISWGEKSIDSAVASVLNSTVPLFTLVIAHLFLHDEPITARKAVGLLIGFAGVLVLMARDLELGSLRAGVLGQAAVLLAAVSYASASVFARRTMREVSPLIQAFVPMAFADALVWSMATQVGEPGGFGAADHVGGAAVARAAGLVRRLPSVLPPAALRRSHAGRDGHLRLPGSRRGARGVIPERTDRLALAGGRGTGDRQHRRGQLEAESGTGTRAGGLTTRVDWWRARPLVVP